MTALAEHGLRIPAEKAEDPKVRSYLGELETLISENPLEGYNNPLLAPLGGKVHRKQLEFHAIKTPPLGIKALIAANRSGKTVACVVDDIIQLVPEELVPEHLKPYVKFEGPVTVVVGAPKNDTHFKNTIPLFRKFMPHAALEDGSFDKAFRSQPNPELQLLNGSSVAFKTYDQTLDAWAGSAAHRIHWDEEPSVAHTQRLREEAMMRLVSTDGDEIIGMTPALGGYTWVYEDVWKERHTNPLVSVMWMGMDDNPWNNRETIKTVEERCKTKDEYRMRVKGEFVHLGGTFFEEFSDERHVVEPPTLEQVKDLDVVVGIDPGFRHTGVTWTGFDSDNSAITFAELDSSEAVTPTASEIKRINAEWGVDDPVYVIDPALVIASRLNAEQVQAAYAREEIYCQGGQKDRRSGILEIKRRLGAHNAANEPTPQWVISNECPALIRQTADYRRDPAAKDEWQAIPQTEEVRFDLIDSVRYAVMSRAWEEAEEEQRRPSYDPRFQPPFSEERDLLEQTDPPPYGESS